jgi:hypothetical protein
VEIIEKNAPRKSNLSITLQVSSIEEDKLQNVFTIAFLSAKFLHFSQQFQISVKLCIVLITIFKFCKEKSLYDILALF